MFTKSSPSVWMKSTTILIAFCITSSYAVPSEQKLPCDYLDSINITNGIRHENKSISFEGVEYTNHLYAEVDFVIENRANESLRVPVQPYLRGCLCKIKKCIRLCCPIDHYYNNSSGICFRNESAKKMVLDDHFAYVHEEPCYIELMFEANDSEIFETGDLVYRHKIYSHQRYCLDASYGNSNFTAMTCEEIDEPQSYASYGMQLRLTALQLVIVTIIVYGFIPELHDIQSKCLLGHLINFVVGYTLLSFRKTALEPLTCTLMEYLIYFALLSTFFWLNVISFNLWQSCRRSNLLKPQRSEQKLFFRYVAYVFGLAFLFMSTAYLGGANKILPEYLPIEGCSTTKHGTAQFLFFYLPMFSSIALDIYLLVLTVRKLRRVEDELIDSGGALGLLDVKLYDDQMTLSMYSPLIVIMSITKILEVFSWLITSAEWWATFSDIFVTTQGVSIYMSFMFRRHVASLLKKRFPCAPEISDEFADGHLGACLLESSNGNANGVLDNSIPENSSEKEQSPNGSLQTE